MEEKVVNTNKEVKPVTEKDVFSMLLDYAEKKAEEIEKRNKEKYEVI